MILIFFNVNNLNNILSLIFNTIYIILLYFYYFICYLDFETFFSQSGDTFWIPKFGTYLKSQITLHLISTEDPTYNMKTKTRVIYLYSIDEERVAIWQKT